ncbi:MAG: staygreen family protein [Bacillota bacterium]|nr:staygreen family protein [Bacillota bacterium]
MRNSFDPSKLSVEYMGTTTIESPLVGRKYTLTHSDVTGQLFLSIGKDYNLKGINQQFLDEVLAEWVPYLGSFILWGRVYISGGEFDEKKAYERFTIFQKELNLALSAIVFGDREFYHYYQTLLDSPIFIQFDSIYPQFNQVLSMGTPRQYFLSFKK